MGLNIGGSPAFLAGGTLTGDLFASRTRDRDLGPRPLGAPEPRERAGPFFQSEPRETPRIGFGKGTISAPGAALDTIGRGVRNAKRSVPTVQEIRQEHRVRMAELREAAVRREFKRPERPERRERPQRRIQVRLPEPSAQARNFINTLNETAAIVQARVSGEEIPSGPGRASFQVNGQAFTFATPTPGAQNLPGLGGAQRFHIDIFV